MTRKTQEESTRQRSTRKTVAKARKRVLTEVRRKGFITNSRAQELGRWAQAWYHLNKMAEAGILRRGDYNRWVLRKPGRRWYRQAKDQLSQHLEG